MTLVRKFHPEVRLKKIVAEAGGMRAADAIDRAHHSLEEIRSDCLAAVDGKVEAIAALARSSDGASLERCYQLANEIFAEAGAFGLKDQSAAALNLCNALSTSAGARRLADILRVHVEAMRALRMPAVAGDEALRAAVLAELRKLTAKLSSE